MTAKEEMPVMAMIFVMAKLLVMIFLVDSSNDSNDSNG